MFAVRFLLLCFQFSLAISKRTLHGRYTRGLTEYEIVLPRRLKFNGAFHSFALPYFYDHTLRRKRHVFYSISINGKPHKIQLVPNFDFISTNAVIEHRHQGSNLSSIEFKNPSQHLCHFNGFIKNQPLTSKVALSTCSGLTGLIQNESETYFIEPILGHNANPETGEHYHLVFKRSPFSSEPFCNVKSDWWNDWGNQLLSAQLASRDLPKGDSDGPQSATPRYIAALVVADKKFLDHHKKINVEEYILVIMNIASRLFNDASLGTIIKLVIVRIVYLYKEKEELSLDISSDASKTIKTFCEWQDSINPTDKSHPNHHDLALLLSRYDLCGDENSCGMVGLAHVASVCNQKTNCAITEDTGLSLGVTVAHELGHNLGLAHDSIEESGCKETEDGINYSVMSPIYNHNIGGWSRCSREFIRNLISSNLGDCLLDKPKEHKQRNYELYPGAVYNHDQQCNFVFGKSYDNCAIGGDAVCGKLWCKEHGSSQCLSDGSLVADGTHCATDKWCFDGNCIQEGQRPVAIDGGWSSWGSWSSCSRSCGGGIRSRQRSCTEPQPQNKGKFCIGSEQEVELCETNACGEELKPFRDVQCSEFDEVPYQGEIVKWVPFLSPELDFCSLLCINGKNQVAELKPRVIDGTRCRPGHKDTCIQGSCVAVGCDWKIGSGSTEDICGICQGDGTHCTIYNEIYNETKTTSGYSKITDIPGESLNIEIRELGSSENMIAIGKTDIDQYFNANYTEEPSGYYKIGGTFGLYSKAKPELEELVIKGPLKESITIFYAFFKGENPGVSLRWVLPTKTAQFQGSYHWEFLEWDDCSVICGGGTQTSHPSCTEAKRGKVNSSLCSSTSKPEVQVRICNTQACKTRWKAYEWSECSGCENGKGKKNRQIACVMENPSPGNGDEIVVNDELCCPDKPAEMELCSSSKPCGNEKKQNEFVNFVYDLESVRRFIANYFKRQLNESDYCLDEFTDASRNSTKSHQTSNIQNFSKTTMLPTVFVDKVDSKKFFLQSINIKPNPMGQYNLSELVFEDEGDRLPEFVPNGSATNFTGREGLNKLHDILQNDHTKNKTSTLTTTSKTSKFTSYSQFSTEISTVGPTAINNFSAPINQTSSTCD